MVLGIQNVSVARGGLKRRALPVKGTGAHAAGKDAD
jgi:hypothetical protein